MVALTSGHVGETPAAHQDRAEWTHGSHGPREAAVLELCRCCVRHVITLVTEDMVFMQRELGRLQTLFVLVGKRQGEAGS